MKNTLISTLFLILPFNLIGQNYSDTLRKSTPPIMLNTNDDLKKVSKNLINAGKSYESSDNLFLLGALSSVIGAIIYSKQNSASGATQSNISKIAYGRLLIGVGFGLNVAAIFYRYDGHSELKESGKNLEKSCSFSK